MAGQEPLSTIDLRPLAAAEELELTVRPLELALRLSESLAGAGENEAGQRALETLAECLRLPAALLFGSDDEGLRLLSTAGVDPEGLGVRAAERLAALTAEGQRLEVQAVALHPRLDKDLRAALQKAGYQALLEIPLRHRQRRRGVLLFLLTAPRVLSVSQSEALLAAARVLGAGLCAAAARDALEAALAQAQDAQRYAEERYQQLGISDSLTGLYNSRHFHGMLEAELERARRFGDSLGLMLLDVDDLTAINEVHGREAGDQVLATLGRILRSSLRKIDSGFRYGGEEFAVILPRCDEAALAALAERVRESFADQPIELDGGVKRLSVSIGAALYRRGAPLESFIRCADRALYEAKARGKNQVVLESR